MVFQSRKNNNNRSGIATIFGLILTVILAYYIAEYIKSQRIASAHVEGNISENYDNDELIRLKNLAQQKQLREKQNAAPFKKKVIYFGDHQQPAIGKLKFETENYDVVFTVKDQTTHKIIAIVQLPQDRHTEIKVPLGRYVVNYALPNGGAWQDLENLWGSASTSYHTSDTAFVISKDFNADGGYTIHNKGMKCCHQSFASSNRHISKSEFFSGS